MTLLLLRGPQTPGELRTRSDRMHSFESVDEVEATLRRMAEGFDALVREIPRRPGQREARWMHLEGAEEHPAEREPEEAPEAPAPRGAASAEREAAADPSGRRTPHDERLERLEAAVEELRGTVTGLGDQLHQLRAELGVE